MQLKTLVIVGMGLIGTALGMSAKRRGVAERILGFDRNPKHLQRALERGAVDEDHNDLPSAITKADLAVFCVPVDRLVDEVLLGAPVCQAGTLLTDVGSTKSVIVQSIEERLPDRVAFVGGHPLAGSEKQGPEFAQDRLFEGRTTILTRTSRTQASALAAVGGFWEALGTHVVVMSPEEHDRAMAFASHLPHLAGVAVARLLPDEFAHLTATGFRDVTRIAAGNPELWAGIFFQNRVNVLDAIHQLNARLNELQAALEGSDWSALVKLLDQAKRVRDALGN